MTPPNFDFVQMSPEEVLLQLPQLLLQRIPKAAQIYNILQLRLRRKLDDDSDFFYYNGLDMECTAIASKLITDTKIWWCILAPIGASERVLEEIMQRFVGLVDWTRPASFNAVDNIIYAHLKTACGNRAGFELTMPGGLYTMSRDTALNFDLKLPQGMSVRPLVESDMSTVFKHWIYADLNPDRDFIKDAGLRLGSIGLLLHGELVSWGMNLGDGGVHIVHTLDSHRGKGYAKILLRHLCHSAAQDMGHFPVVHVQTDNDSSIGLMTSVGFTLSHTISWSEYTA